MPDLSRPWIRRGMWLITIAFWCVCIYMTHVPKPPSFTNDIHNDKIKHFFGYAVLASLLYGSLWINGLNWRRAALLTVAILAIYGGLDERTQPWTGRSCDIHDWYADVAGVISAVLFWSLLRWGISGSRMRLSESTK